MKKALLVIFLVAAALGWFLVTLADQIPTEVPVPTQINGVRG